MEEIIVVNNCPVNTDTYKCPICMSDISIDSICKTDCNHQFCKSCLDTWFNRGENSCPTCRNNINYFDYKNNKNRIIIINNNENNENNENNLQAITNDFQVIIKKYLVLIKFQKYMLFLISSLLFIYSTSYYNLTQQNDNLIHRYNNCIQNNTLLYLENRRLNSREFVNIDLLYNGFLTACRIPIYFYQACIKG